MIEMSVTHRGPLFDSQASHITSAFLEDATGFVAQQAEDMVRTELGAVIQHSTGHYIGSVATRNTSNGAVVSDGGVVYGPWLEGTSSRNSTTQFKGYTTFRRIAQKVQGEVAQMIDSRVKRYVERLNG